MSLTAVTAASQDYDLIEMPEGRPLWEGVRAQFEIPCTFSPKLSTMFGASVSICDVTLGPTRSWKDCVAPGVVEAALQLGAKGVVVASSGNHGRAIAYACRAAGLQSAVLVYDRTPANVIASLIELSAEVLRYQDRASVHAALDFFVSEGWYSATLTDRLRSRGAMPGSEGYRRIALAIKNGVDGKPIVVVPTCYGDGATAIRRDLINLGRDPHMCLVRAHDADGFVAASIATDVLTPQVANMLACGALDVNVTNTAFHVGIGLMEAAVGKSLDCAEGGIPAALARLASADRSVCSRPIVCVVTGSILPGLGPDQR